LKLSEQKVFIWFCCAVFMMPGLLCAVTSAADNEVFPKRVTVVYRPLGADAAPREDPDWARPGAAVLAMREGFKEQDVFSVRELSKEEYEEIEKKNAPLVFSPEAGLVVLFDVQDAPPAVGGLADIARVDACLRVQVMFGAEFLVSGTFRDFVHVNLRKAASYEEGVNGILKNGLHAAIAKAARRAAIESLKFGRKRFHTEFAEVRPTAVPPPMHVLPQAGSDPTQPRQSSPPVSAAGTRWALVIGCGNFSVERIAPRPEAGTSAKVFFEALMKGGVYQRRHSFLLLDKNATHAAVEAKLDLISSMAKAGDRVLIYIAGRGVPVDSSPGSISYVLLHDSRMSSLPQSALSLAKPDDTFLNRFRHQQLLVLLDANYSAGAIPGMGNVVVLGSDISTRNRLGIDQRVTRRILPEQSILIASSPEIKAGRCFLETVPRIIGRGKRGTSLTEVVGALRKLVPGGVVVAQKGSDGMTL